MLKKISGLIGRITARAYGDSNWDGASGNRSLRDWNPGLTSPDGAAAYERETISARAQDLDRNEALARATLDAQVTNVVGIGMRPVPNPDWRALGKSPEWAVQWSRTVRSVVGNHFDSTDIDATRHQNLHGLSRTAFREMMTTGSALALFVFEEQTGVSKYGTAIHLISGDRLSNENDGMDTVEWRGGVKLNRYGAPEAYSIRNHHPGDAIFLANTMKWEVVPAFTAWGRRNVLHMFTRKRVGQSRGMSILATAMPEIRQGNRQLKAEVDAAVADALIAFFVRSPASQQELLQMFGSSEAYMKARAEYKPGLKTAQMVTMFPGDDITSHRPARPNMMVVQFQEFLASRIAASTGMSREVVQRDFAKMNYSSARAMFMELYKYFLEVRSELETMWYNPIYHNTLEEAVHAGDIPNCTPDDFYANTLAWTRCDWRGPARGWVDPKKEAEASEIMLRTNQTTLAAICAEQGLDWMDVLEQRAAERAYAISLGLPADLPPPPTPGPSPEPDEDETERTAQ